MKKSLLILTMMLSLSVIILANEDGKWPKLEGEFLNNHNPKAQEAELDTEYFIINEIVNSDLDWDQVDGYNKLDIEKFTNDYVNGYIEDDVLKKGGMDSEKIEVIRESVTKYKQNLNGIYSPE